MLIKIFKKNTFVVGRIIQCMLVNAFIYAVVTQQKCIVFSKLKPADEDRDTLLKLKINWRDLLEFSVSLKKYFSELCLKILRTLVRLSVSGFLFQKAGPV